MRGNEFAAMAYEIFLCLILVNGVFMLITLKLRLFLLICYIIYAIMAAHVENHVKLYFLLYEFEWCINMEMTK